MKQAHYCKSGIQHMQTLTLNKEHFDSGNNYIGEVAVENYSGHIEIWSGLGQVNFKSICAAGHIYADTGTGIDVGGDIQAGGDIEVGGHVYIGGDIEVGGDIQAGGEIEVGGHAHVGKGIQAGEGIYAQEGVKLGMDSRNSK